MDPITLITTAVGAGGSIVGTKLLENATQEAWNCLMERLRGKATGNQAASTALAKPDDRQQVLPAVQAIDAANDPEIVELACNVNAALPASQLDRTQRQVVQIAKQIINAEHVDTMNFN